MSPTVNPAEALEQLAGRVEDLERRVAELEQRPILLADAPTPTVVLPASSRAVEQEDSIQFGSAVTVIGIALLGLAGAYILRALAGAAVLPRLVLGLAGAGYAIGWAIAAVRNARPFAGGFYAASSVLMLAPMLWEMCLRFHAMTAAAAATILAASLVASVVAARSRYQSPAFSFFFAGSAVTALALCIGTRSMMPFIAILLAMAIFCEAQRFRLRTLPVAWFVLVAADAAILALLFIYRAPEQARPEYPWVNVAVILAAPIVLFFLQAIAIATQVFARRQKIGAFDALQTMAAFGLLAAGAFWIAPSFARLFVGSLCLVLCGVCYWAAFDPRHRVEDRRNFRLFATWAVLLLAWGLYVAMPPAGAAVAFALGPVVAILAAQRLHSTTLEAHAVVYLVLAAFACGLPVYEWHAMLADAPRFPAGTLLIAAALAIAAYAVCTEQIAEDARHQVIHLAFALIAACAACAFLTHLLLAGVGLAVRLQDFHIALVRTLSICALAVALALGGAGLRRASMARVAYVLLGFVVLKLVFEDLRHGHFGYLAASIGIVAVTMMLVPRVAARRVGL